MKCLSGTTTKLQSITISGTWLGDVFNYSGTGTYEDSVRAALRGQSMEDVVKIFRMEIWGHAYPSH